jgi:translation elongation factor EF-G
MSQIEEWFRKKLEQKKGSISSLVIFEGKFQRIYGPRADFAHVVLSFEPASDFVYVSEAEWPMDEERCNSAIIEGILDVLTSSFQEYWYTNIKVTLKEIKFHPVDSSPRAFYKAARNAAEKLVFEHKNEHSILKSHL